MALNRVYYLKTRTQDKTIAVFADATEYGGVENERVEEAHFIVIAKMDENQALTFLTGIDNTTPLTSIEFSVVQSVDGAYRLIAFNPLFYNGATNYIATNIIWHPGSAAFYKCTAPISGVEPSVTAGWADYWTATIDFTAEVSNATVDKYIHDDIITFRYEDCLVTELDEINDDILCSVCNKFDELFNSMAMQLLLAGANSNNWQGKQTKSEVIIVEATKKFCC